MTTIIIYCITMTLIVSIQLFLVYTICIKKLESLSHPKLIKAFSLSLFILIVNILAISKYGDTYHVIYIICLSSTYLFTLLLQALMIKNIPK
jgi:hypothetical protein